MPSFIASLQGLSEAAAWAWFAVLNLAVLGLGLGAGKLLLAIPGRRVAPLPPPITGRELVLTVLCAALNTFVTWLGWQLWKFGIVEFRSGASVLSVLADVLTLLFVMDSAMYVLHRIAHQPWFYSWLHDPHHRYPHPRPLTLFVLHPLEALGFGALWLAVISVYDATWLGMSIYLALNVAFGIIGHLGVEHAPRSWARLPGVGWLATAAFHSDHHLRPTENYGFYSSIWDRLGGTYGDPERRS